MGESSCDINEQTGQCELHQENPADGERDQRQEEEREEEVGQKSDERRYFRVPTNSSTDTCPLEPEHQTCLLVRLWCVVTVAYEWGSNFTAHKLLVVAMVFSLVWICGLN